ncbi:MAG: hypothetical protein WDN50_08820 [Bradyrhizobium sp.]
MPWPGGGGRVPAIWGIWTDFRFLAIFFAGGFFGVFRVRFLAIFFGFAFFAPDAILQQLQSCALYKCSYNL